ncbi:MULTISPECIES: CmcJ/NvfI family oxidoreductase [Trichocoleus]|uniref:Methyltransferase n=1 Tax=Trichocoleus desertorum GB2-A4 TaxID=2933944 RepID=A0ABV0JHD0_9CYAN|nr:CmcJ/NvfI family oxidoreductase [Trichocoleus sp. FACHB-46]MBD1865107.1 methyltransferase [Trichocoleus sp. FACHB-46]
MSLVSPVFDHAILADLPSVTASLNYLLPMTDKPVNYTYEPPAGIPRQSGVSAAYEVPIYDARSLIANLSLDRQGFALVEQHSAAQDFYDDDVVRRIYYPEAEQLLKQVTGATRVVVFDHVVRNAQRSQSGTNDIKEPVRRVHNDFTANSAYTRGRLVLSEMGEQDPDALLKQRFSIINLWRAIANPIQESPLAVCDARSITSTDLVASDLVYRDRVGETYSVTYNPSHQWFYFPQMHRDEVLLIKCFDADESGRARFAAHTSFEDPTSPVNAPPRESIELRTLVFYPD